MLVEARSSVTCCRVDKKILEVEDKINKEFSIMKCHIASIKGIGIITAAGILAEIENIDRFDNPGQLCAFAGIEPSENQSGTHDGGGKMVKHGSPHLRNYLMQGVGYMLIHNPVLYENYLKKRNEGKCHTVALSHVAKRLTRIIFYLEKNDTDFNNLIFKRIMKIDSFCREVNLIFDFF